MRAQQYLPPHRPRRAGFTMIEILIVITIIALLATLTFRGIQSSLQASKRTQEIGDVTQLAMGLQAFKDQFGVYPPSRIRLCENTPYYSGDPLDQVSVKYLKRMWPRIQIDVRPGDRTTVDTLDPEDCMLWCQDDPNNKTPPTTADPGNLDTTGQVYELEGDECLVFFLGGIAEFDRNNIGNRPIILHGFSTNAQRPGSIPNATDPTTTSRVGPFFQFDASRLYVRDFDDPNQVLSHGDEAGIADEAFELADFNAPGTGNNALPRTAKLPSYRSFQSTSTAPLPVVYFSAYEGEGYRPMDVALPRAMITDDPVDTQYLLPFQLKWPVITTEANHVACPGPNPYTITRSGPTPDPTAVDPTDTDPPDTAGAIMKPYEPQTFQIISPGGDGKFGRGGKLPPAVDFATNDPQYDNVSNVTGGQSVGAFAESRSKKQ